MEVVDEEEEEVVMQEAVRQVLQLLADDGLPVVARDVVELHTVPGVDRLAAGDTLERENGTVEIEVQDKVIFCIHFQGVSE